MNFVPVKSIDNTVMIYTIILYTYNMHNKVGIICKMYVVRTHNNNYHYRPAESGTDTNKMVTRGAKRFRTD